MTTLEPTKAMVIHATQRTKEHIKRVQDNARALCELVPDLLTDSDWKVFSWNIEHHDIVKFSAYEWPGYVWLSWYYKEKDEGRTPEPPEGYKQLTRDAWEHHAKSCSHHPEFWATTWAPDQKEALEVSYMPAPCVVEMVCDWHAMSQELGGSTREWFESQNKKRWLFTPDTERLIQRVIDVFEPKTE